MKKIKVISKKYGTKFILCDDEAAINLHGEFACTNRMLGLLK